MSKFTLQQLRAGSRGQVSLGRLSRYGTYSAVLSGMENQLELRHNAPARVIKKKQLSLTALGFRTFLRLDGTCGTEFLYAVEGTKGVHRYDIERGKSVTSFAIDLDFGEGSIIRENADGRYVCVCAADGHMEVWNFDMPSARCLYSRHLTLTGDPSEASFDVSNRRLALATASGQIAAFDLSVNETLNLHATNSWPCLAIAWQPKSIGLVCGGDGSALWMIDMKTRGNTEVHLDDLPLNPDACQLLASNGFLGVPWSPRRLSCLKTTVGDVIRQILFLDNETVAIRGELGIEVWNLTTCKRLNVTRISKDTRGMHLVGKDQSLCFLREM